MSSIGSFYFSLHDYSISVGTRGGTLRSLRYFDRPLLEEFQSWTSGNFFAGALLAPWPNRIRDGRYEIQGTTYQLPINEVARHNALHGLIYNLEWHKIKGPESGISLETILLPSDFYPSPLQFVVNYTLSKFGLIWTLSATNIGREKVPYGASIHPYLVADPNTGISEWNLKMPATQFLDVDKERLLPTSMKRCEDRGLLFSDGLLIGDLVIDHAFKIDREMPDQRIELRSQNGSGVWMEFNDASNWIQLHTADRDGSSRGRRSMVIEPMSCPTNAFNSGTDLYWLHPQESHEMQWKIGAISN